MVKINNMVHVRGNGATVSLSGTGPLFDLDDGADVTFSGLNFRDDDSDLNAGRTICHISGAAKRLVFYNCRFEGRARALLEGGGSVDSIDIIRCHFEDTSYRCFGFTGRCNVRLLNCTGHNVGAVALYLPSYGDHEGSHIISGNRFASDTDFVSNGGGSYFGVVMAFGRKIVCERNRAEGMKVTKENASPGPFDLRGVEVESRDNEVINCGVCNDSGSFRERRLLNCKSHMGGPDSSPSAIYERDSWLIEPEYFESQSLPVPKVVLGPNTSRDLVVRDCVFTVPTLVAPSASDRRVRSMEIQNFTLTASSTEGLSINSGLFWIDQQGEGGPIRIEDCSFSFGEVSSSDGTDRSVFRMQGSAADVTLMNTVISADNVDNFAWILPDAAEQAWTVENFTFDGTRNGDVWRLGRQPGQLIENNANYGSQL